MSSSSSIHHPPGFDGPGGSVEVVVVKEKFVWTRRKIESVAFFLFSLIALSFAFTLAAGVFGLGKAHFLAGGCVVGSMALFGIGTYLALASPKIR